MVGFYIALKKRHYMSEVIKKLVQFETKSYKNAALMYGLPADADLYDIIISTDDIDSYGDIMVPKGCDSSIIDVTKAVFYQHETNNYPIAKHLALRISNDNKKLIATIWFNEITDVSKTVKQLVDLGNINCVSIGFIGIESQDYMLTDAEKEQIQSPWVSRKRIYKKWSLHEYSIVNIPMNINATIEQDLRNKGYFDYKGDEMIEEKAGRKLSGKNLERIKTAHEAAKKVYDNISEVISEAEDVIEDLQETEKMLNEISELKSQIADLKSQNDELNSINSAIKEEMKSMVKINIVKV